MQQQASASSPIPICCLRIATVVEVFVSLSPEIPRKSRAWRICVFDRGLSTRHRSGIIHGEMQYERLGNLGGYLNRNANFEQPQLERAGEFGFLVNVQSERTNFAICTPQNFLQRTTRYPDACIFGVC